MTACRLSVRFCVRQAQSHPRHSCVRRPTPTHVTTVTQRKSGLRHRASAVEHVNARVRPVHVPDLERHEDRSGTSVARIMNGSFLSRARRGGCDVGRREDRGSSPDSANDGLKRRARLFTRGPSRVKQQTTNVGGTHTHGAPGL